MQEILVLPIFKLYILEGDVNLPFFEDSGGRKSASQPVKEMVTKTRIVTRTRSVRKVVEEIRVDFYNGFGSKLANLEFCAERRGVPHQPGK
jgi:hypothetical protein